MKFSGSKCSSMEKKLTKFRFLEVVPMETVTDALFLFNDRYLSRGSSYCLEILAICAPGPKVHFLFRT